MARASDLQASSFGLNYIFIYFYLQDLYYAKVTKFDFYNDVHCSSKLPLSMWFFEAHGNAQTQFYQNHNYRNPNQTLFIICITRFQHLTIISVCPSMFSNAYSRCMATLIDATMQVIVLQFSKLLPISHTFSFLCLCCE